MPQHFLLPVITLILYMMDWWEAGKKWYRINKKDKYLLDKKVDMANLVVDSLTFWAEYTLLV